jgi:hypothetical protein
MSGTASEAPERYRPVGKHRFGLQLMGLVVLTASAIWAADHFFGDLGSGRYVVWLLIALIWVGRCVRTILAPERDAEAEGAERSLRSIRVEAVIFLVLWTAFATINAWGIALRFWPGIAS